MFQIDARHRLDADTAVEHGRIFISISSDGLPNHIYDIQRVEVSEFDVFLRVKFMSSSPMTLYAVRRITIASQATSFKFPLFLMQPYAAPNSPLFSGHSKGDSNSSAWIADYSCAEVDISSSDGLPFLQLAADENVILNISRWSRYSSGHVKQRCQYGCIHAFVLSDQRCYVQACTFLSD
jgi:hypothetical protein